MKIHISLISYPIVVYFIAGSAYGRPCEPMYISMTDAMQHSQFEQACENCEDKLPELECGWKWNKSYIIDYSNPAQEWRWQSWPDNVTLIISARSKG